MAKNDKKVTKNIVKLSPRIHINEYLSLHHKDMDSIQKAGFMAFAGDKVWMRLKEWKELYKKYKTRNKERGV